MEKPHNRPVNPFGVTKAVDLNDDQIQSLWVNVSGNAEEFAEFARPASPMPTFILGAKGSGKTHLMRYHAFELQKLRYRKKGTDVRKGVAQDGYIGIYMRCSGLNSGRFSGKRQPEDKWAAIFSYYIELWLTQHLLSAAQELGIDDDAEESANVCVEILSLFDKAPTLPKLTLGELAARIRAIQRELDYAVNNCVMTGRLEVEILATRGQLIFGIPQILIRRFEFLRDVMFVYSLDEFENLTVEQQRFVNTLVREKELPTTLRIGSRLYGIKTNATESAGEENLRDSEFETLPIDQLFRQHKTRYAQFAKALIEKRLAAAYGLANDSEASVNLAGWADSFETVNDEWDSSDLFDLVKRAPSYERRHFLIAAEKLVAFGLNNAQVEAAIRLLSSEKYPLLEKNNLLLLYQDLHRGKNPLESASEISKMCLDHIENGTRKGRYASTLDHYKADLIAQLNKENDGKQQYLGIENFITMSTGLPRALLTILRSVYDWSQFRGESPFSRDIISREAQWRGVKDASDWFYENMRKAGQDGIAIQTSIERIARLFRVNRFADKPTECSLITFSLPEQDVSPQAKHILQLAESRSFLNRIPGGQRDKNSERVLMKFQLNNMLSPRWDLPLGRRGTFSFTAPEIDMLFDPSKSEEFDVFLAEWSARRTAPFFGKQKQPVGDDAQQALF